MVAAVLIAVLAQEPPAQAGRPWYEILADNSLGIMIGLIFLSTIVGVFAAQRRKDRCLKKFNHFAVTVLEQTGRAIWGRLRVFSNGLEVVFSAPARHGDAPVKESFLYYQTEWTKLLSVVRYVDELGGGQQGRRRRQLRKMASPGPMTRLARRFRNFINTFRDAIVNSFSVAMSQAQKSSKSAVLQTGGKDLTTIGTTLVGEAGNAYEPMLEQYFGREVIAEVVNPADPDKRIVEIVGYLGEYSAANVLLVECEQPTDDVVAIPADHHRRLAQWIDGRRDGEGLVVTHRGDFPATVTGVRCGDAHLDVAKDLTPGGETTVELDRPLPAGQAVLLDVRVRRTFDVIVPRAIAAVRHKASFHKKG